MRPRIAMSIVSASDDKYISRETPVMIEKARRRAQFERNRKFVKKATLDNILFSDGVKHQIEQFKKRKRLCTEH